MSGLKSSRNLLEPPTLVRAGNPEVCPSWGDPGVKSFPMMPHMWFYIAWAPDYFVTNAEFNIDLGPFAIKVGLLMNKVLACIDHACKVDITTGQRSSHSLCEQGIKMTVQLCQIDKKRI